MLDNDSVKPSFEIDKNFTRTSNFNMYYLRTSDGETFPTSR